MSRLKYKSTFLSDQQKTINISIGARLRQARLGRKILIVRFSKFKNMSMELIHFL